uniref:PMEI domain-containing protein n=1 Tax=Heterorhabditis bacteriophora TaxID=37862 RepID=A0A1I7XHB6_HETBA
MLKVIKILITYLLILNVSTCIKIFQITTLVNFKESYLTNGKPKSERAIRAALKVGSAVEAAIERFVSVGETIADENPDIQPEMYDACHEARLAAQMGVARTTLERMTMLLLTSSKTLLRHPESDSALQCRNGIFDQIRMSLQLIAICVSDGVFPLESSRYAQTTSEEPLDIGLQLTANAAIKQLTVSFHREESLSQS